MKGWEKYSQESHSVIGAFTFAGHCSNEVALYKPNVIQQMQIIAMCWQMKLPIALEANFCG
jgi:hypothetical protein